MTLITDIEQDLKEARLAREDARRDALSLLLAALRSAEKDLQRQLSEDEGLQVLQRERKKRVEAIEAYRSAGREAQAEAEELELDVIEDYMPEQLSEDEIEEIVDDVIAEVGATSLRDLGRVKGIGPKTLARLEPHVAAGSAPLARPEASAGSTGARGDLAGVADRPSALFCACHRQRGAG